MTTTVPCRHCKGTKFLGHKSHNIPCHFCQSTGLSTDPEDQDGYVPPRKPITNQRFIAYAKSQGRTSEDQLAHDTEVFPGGKMTGFTLWMGECRAEAMTRLSIPRNEGRKKYPKRKPIPEGRGDNGFSPLQYRTYRNHANGKRHEERKARADKITDERGLVQRIHALLDKGYAMKDWATWRIYSSIYDSVKAGYEAGLPAPKVLPSWLFPYFDAGGNPVMTEVYYVSSSTYSGQGWGADSYAQKDAELFAEGLRGFGFEVEVVTERVTFRNTRGGKSSYVNFKVYANVPSMEGEKNSGNLARELAKAVTGLWRSFYQDELFNSAKHGATNLKVIYGVSKRNYWD